MYKCHACIENILVPCCKATAVWVPAVQCFSVFVRGLPPQVLMHLFEQGNGLRRGGGCWHGCVRVYTEKFHLWSESSMATKLTVHEIAQLRTRFDQACQKGIHIGYGPKWAQLLGATSQSVPHGAEYGSMDHLRVLLHPTSTEAPPVSAVATAVAAVAAPAKAKKEKANKQVAVEPPPVTEAPVVETPAANPDIIIEAPVFADDKASSLFVVLGQPNFLHGPYGFRPDQTVH